VHLDRSLPNYQHVGDLAIAAAGGYTTQPPLEPRTTEDQADERDKRILELLANTTARGEYPRRTMRGAV
jgi:hypothetical protein